MCGRLLLFLLLFGFGTRPSIAADIVVMAGLVDDFALPADPASPSAALLALPMNFQNFDLIAGVNGGLPDRQVAHTFTGLPDDIESAILELRIRAGNDGGVVSDGLLISFVDPATVLYCGGAVVYARSFAPTAGAGCFPVPDATGLVGSWTVGQVATLVLDLAALPLAAGGTLDMIPQMNSLGFIDINVSDETGCDFMQLSIDTTAATSVGPTAAPDLAILHRPLPNPFNAATTFRFELERSADITFSIYDVAGRRVRTLAQGVRPRGQHEIAWDGKDDRGARMASGLYFGALRVDAGVWTTKAVLLK